MEQPQYQVLPVAVAEGKQALECLTLVNKGSTLEMTGLLLTIYMLESVIGPYSTTRGPGSTSHGQKRKLEIPGKEF